jgi:hypothetical protein
MKLKTLGHCKTYCTPADPKDLPLFKHCTDGQQSCLKERVFDGDIQSILLAHGVHSIEMVDTKEQDDLGHVWLNDEICIYCGHSKKYAENNNCSCFNNELVSWISK